MAVITLLTDFGEKDGYPGIMQGVIYSIAPDARVVDLSHSVHPQGIFEGSLALLRAMPYFPAGSVHVGVVDPGVGTERLPIAARLGQQFFVGPDNGLVTSILEYTERGGGETYFVHLDRPGFWLPTVSKSFHGRDIFAPVGAHLANGVPLEEVGTPIEHVNRLYIPQPDPLDKGWSGEVIHIDHFGNVATNIRANHLLAFNSFHIKLNDHTIDRFINSYGDAEEGDLIALIDSSGYLSLAVVNGRAADVLETQSGDTLEVINQH